MKRAAGVMFVAPDGRVLLMRRTSFQDGSAGQWAFPGGEIEGDETPEQAARRETTEETGFDPAAVAFMPWLKRTANDVEFTTHLAQVPAAFEPVMNSEHDSFQWVERDNAMTLDLHPGAKIALLRMDMDELGVAKAIKAGEIDSPVRYGNIMLVALRITGTGASYRKQLDEFVWRDPSLYLNDYFVERCNGLSVILEHPPGGQPLDTNEYRKRIIGAIMLPYIKGDEVWGIAKIHDMDAAALIEEEKLSTSPCVVFVDEGLGTTYELDKGQHLLIEGKPSLLDHVAICELGVWDKGGEAKGIAITSSDSLPTETTTMADDSSKTRSDGDTKPDTKSATKSDSGLTDTKEGQLLDTILAHLDSRLDARFDAFGKRMDAFEAMAKKDAAKSDDDDDKKSDAAKGDANEEENKQPKMDASKSDDDDDRCDDDHKKADGTKADDDDDKKRADARADTARLERQIADLQRRIPVELPEEDRARFVRAQEGAERVAQAFGDSAGAPRWLNGESIANYTRRLLGKYKQHSKAWKDKDLSKVDESVLDIASGQIYSDAYEAAIHPVSDGAEMLREVIETDRTGRRISKFYGSPEACWGIFKQVPRYVRRLDPKGADQV